MDTRGSGLRWVKIVSLILVFVPGLWLRLQVFSVAKYFTVVYGNTATHISWANLLLRTWQFPLWEPSYGGKPSLYVPLYRLLLAAVALLFKGDVVYASSIITVASTVAPIGLFLVVRALTRRFYPSLLAVLVSETSSQLVIYTARPLPQFLGMTLLPIAIYLFLQRKYTATVITSILIAMAHQETALVLVLVLSAYLVLVHIFGFIKRHGSPRANPSLKISVQRAELIGCMASISMPILSYLLWQNLVIGTSNIFALAQFAFHEHSIVTWEHVLEVGVTCVAFGALGAVIFYVKERASRNGVLMASWLLVCVLASKNEVFAPLAPNVFPVMCDRFLAYLGQVLSVFAAIGVFDVFKGILQRTARRGAKMGREAQGL